VSEIILGDLWSFIESKFEVIHNTLIGNTVIENAQVTVISIYPALQVAQAERWIDDEDDK
jgi:hypothetical protein